MKLFNKSIKLSVSLAALFFAQSSFAEVGITDPGGTRAGTVVENTAVLSYQVGGVAQSDITSAVSDFTVDRKVDLTVTGDSAVNVKVGPSSPRSTVGNKLTYVLSNDGNDTQKFKIAVSHLTSDQFDAGTAPTTAGPQAAETCQFTIDGGTPTDVTNVSYVTLDIDEDATIVVSCSMPNRPDVDDADLSTIDVLATAVDASNVIMKESTGADQEDAIDVVLADGVGVASDVGGPNADGKRNAMHSATQTYEIDAPMLSVVKTSKVTEDPYNGTTQPKRIPGATVEYTITISNTSDSEATGVKITDILTAAVAGEVEFVAGSIVNSAGTTEGYDAATHTVTAEGITVPAAVGGTDGEVTVTFKVTIL